MAGSHSAGQNRMSARLYIMARKLRQKRVGTREADEDWEALTLCRKMVACRGQSC
jgi:hypothetical protein